MGIPTPIEAGVKAVLSSKARVSRERPRMSWEWPWLSQRDEASVGTSPRTSLVVKLVMELHHVNQGG